VTCCECRYHNHVIAYDETLLPHFLGMYRYKSAFGTSHLRFIVMNNLFATINPLHHRYDIKVSACLFDVMAACVNWLSSSGVDTRSRVQCS
jgi:hypothetical protein